MKINYIYTDLLPTLLVDAVVMPLKCKSKGILHHTMPFFLLIFQIFFYPHLCLVFGISCASREKPSIYDYPFETESITKPFRCRFSKIMHPFVFLYYSLKIASFSVVAFIYRAALCILLVIRSLAVYYLYLTR